MKLNIRALDLNLLPVFVAVVEEGKLSRAAERLSMSQPAVSAALKRLRLTVGDPLFSRTRAGMVPTPRAQQLYQQVSVGLDQLVNAVDPHQEFLPADSHRTFRLAVADYFEAQILGELIHRVRQQSQDIRVFSEGLSSGWLRRLVHGEVDIALDTHPVEDERILACVACHERLRVVARKGHPRISGTLDLETFLQLEHVVLPPRQSNVLPLEQLLGCPGWQRKIGAQVGRYLNLLTVAGETDMIATVPDRLAHIMAGQHKLQILPFPVPADPVPIYMLWPRVMDTDPAHHWFRQTLAEVISTVMED